MPLLTVSMPVGGALPLLKKAAGSVLAQDVDLHLVIVNDGGSPEEVRSALGELAEDKRLTVYDLPTRRGRYFADAVVYAATDSPLFTIHDADDYSEPGRYARMIGLLESTGADVVPGGVTHHWLSGKTDREPPRLPLRSDARAFHPWNNCALYRRGALQGLMRPDFTVGYDTLLAHILARTATVHVDPTCDYHWVQRADSLTQAPGTGHNSATRKKAQADIARIVRRLNSQRPGRLAVRRALVLMPPVPKRRADDVSAAALDLREMLEGPSEPVDASDIVLTILTGARPSLLDQTLRGVERRLPGLLETAEVHVLVNGGDRPTLDVVEKYRYSGWLVFAQPGPIATIGQATSWCAARAVESERPYWMHLEDDWAAHKADGALDFARELLRDRPEVSQVRLRQASEGGFGRNADHWAKNNVVTHRPLVWEEHGSWSYSPDCHLTQTPFLMRSDDAKDAYPAVGEHEAMRQWRDAGHLGIARVLPGVFTHIGGRESLKMRTGCPA